MKLIPLALLLVAAPALARDKKAPAAPPLPTSVDGLPIGAIPTQQLPARGCAAFLWTRGPSHALVAMAVADPSVLRLSIGGKVQDFALTAQHGTGGYGFSQSNEYRGGDVTATLDLQVAAADDVPGGARVGDSTLRIDRAGQDTIVVSVGGMIGCA
ncbi:MAG: hypothetical protein J0I47_05915 [Sphingomonas sp.]|uniref:hypothetical protein n=1 Tax=Sphingomonas sp. TaxID=28214 RepID=UPI001ACE8090|nr:hypothetical protein [Sphingomonas sp.]MBN8807755.1 hypothetical protein [Sphingomonas sp.]